MEVHYHQFNTAGIIPVTFGWEFPQLSYM